MVKLALVDLLALLDLLERGESKDNRDLLVSRVCQDQLVPQERQENPETRVFLVRVEFLVLLDLEVSVVSLVSAVVQDHKVFRDLVEFLEHLELMDPRELLDQLVLLDPKDHLACRVCLEREEPVAFQELRETEVTVDKRDLRELLERMVLEV